MPVKRRVPRTFRKDFENMKYDELEKKYDASSVMINTWRKRLGIKKKIPVGSMIPDEFCELYFNLNLLQLAIRYNRSEATMVSWAKIKNLPTKRELNNQKTI